ncbi:30S ribosomal protein S10 [Striga asiatica]|uniref:30S ribosomal protein S10 n=1 Tax=Striga asiatica TaxID=4170 RepID=A0A5A7PZ86_STRAF|nr:30S ribosomal protein S10 [Striga asiatica]
MKPMSLSIVEIATSTEGKVKYRIPRYCSSCSVVGLRAVIAFRVAYSRDAVNPHIYLVNFIEPSLSTGTPTSDGPLSAPISLPSSMRFHLPLLIPLVFINTCSITVVDHSQQSPTPLRKAIKERAIGPFVVPILFRCFTLCLFFFVAEKMRSLQGPEEIYLGNASGWRGNPMDIRPVIKKSNKKSNHTGL